MKDEKGPEKRLTEELDRLRQRVAELEGLEAGRRWAEKRIEHLNEVLRAIRNVNQLITREKNRRKLLEGICKNLIETRNYLTAWIAAFDEAGKLLSASETGWGRKFTPMLKRLKSGEMPYCARRILAQSDVELIDDPRSACGDCPLLKHCFEVAAVAVGLKHGERVYGLLSITLPKDFVLDEEEQSLLREVASDVAFALHDMELEEERRRAEKAVREAREYAESIVDTVREPLVVLDADLRVVSANRSFYGTFRVTPEETEGRLLYELGNRQWDIPELRRLLEEILPQNTSFEDYEVEHDFETIGRRTMLLNARRIYREANKTQLILLAIEDITERKRAEEALRVERDKLRALVDGLSSMGIGLDIVGVDYRIRYQNRVLLERFGDVTGQLCHEKYMGFSEPCDFCPMMKAMESRSVASAELTAVDGRQYLLLSSPLVNLDGTVDAAIEVVLDITERKRAEDALRENEEKYRLHFENVSDVIYSFDSDLKVLAISPSIERVLGYKPEELVGKPIFEHGILAPEYLETAANNLRMVFSGERVGPVEYEFIAKDGTRKFGEISGAPIVREGEVVAALLVGRDVTERKQAEQALRESEERYRTVFENTGTATVIVEEDTTISLANKKFEELTGLTREEIEGKRSWSEFVVEEDLERMKEYHRLRRANPNLAPKEYEFRFRDVEGNIRDILLTIDVIPGTKKSVASLLDITDRKRTERALEAEKERLLVTMRSIGDGVIATDTDGRIMLMNEVAEKLTGWSQSESVGRFAGEVFHIVNEQTRERCENPVQKVLARGGIVGLANDTVLISRDGTERIIADSGAPIRDKDGDIIGVVLVFRDITEKRKMEQELLKTQKLESVGILAGGIAHDFNNMLTAILGNITLAKMQADSGSKVYERLNEAEKASYKAKDLTQQLLTFSKGGIPVKKVLSVSELIKASTEFALRGSNVRCDFSLADDLWSVEADEGQLNQVVNNLILNAVQAMPGGGVINVVAENVYIEEDHPLPLEPGRYVMVLVRDEGIGIPKDILPRIFDPYFTTKQKGSGLGLATTYSIIKSHGGHITVESELGEGSTFCFYMPASERAISSMGVDEDGLVHGAGRILVMDDEEMVRDFVSGLLQEIGYEVEVASDGRETIELYKKARGAGRPFDAVIIDLTVPGAMGGKEAVKRLLAIDPNVKAIVSSGYSNDPVMANPGVYGFVDVLAKPFKAKELSEVLHRVIKKAD